MSDPAPIYIVMGTTGEFSDRSEWLVAAYASKEMAERHALLCAQWVEQNVNRTDSAKFYAKDHANPYDPNMRVDFYTGVDWFVQSVPLRSEPPNV